LRIEVGSAYTILFFAMTMPLLVAMQRLGGQGEIMRGVDAAHRGKNQTE